ncbi:M10 family metallopeptidase C-terminal domain-containing protein [Pararhizobium sp. YC-54]|uniref:calcium-binding protein n=1 Tax=Pararhizobium sp. YC-54 TaxID=2986920 RepID=UPI0021F7CEBE|nr:calcium-binding protein [Pararhizobium sp. YC-54]MCW0000313.1 M10 family metallopeptidase C-terminal domain-containing protein [Pararhizobium sp. YC-54]
MATLQSYFPGSIYPDHYDPPIPGVVSIASLDILISGQDAELLSSSSTKQLWQLSNGLKIELMGSGFKHDGAGSVTAGTATSLKLLLNDGTSLLKSLTGITWQPKGNNPFYDGYTLQAEWLAGNDTIKGGNGDEDLYGHTGRDTISSGGGNDYVDGGEGKDTYDGGAGIDYLAFVEAHWNVNAKHGIKLDAVAGTVIDPYGNSETFKNFEAYRGTQFADTIKGSAKDELFMGFEGADVIDGGGGKDLLRYERDSRYGGNAGIVVNLRAGTIRDGFGDQDIVKNVEDIRGTEQADAMTGSAVANMLDGQGGNDTINGDAGSDVLYGGAGTDKLTGASGNDKLYGDAGNDTLYGGSGGDRLYGGAGADTFVYKATADSSVAAADTIFDFSLSSGDRIHLSGIDANTKLSANQAFTFIGTAGFHGSAGELRIVKDASDTYVYGDKTIDFAIHLDDALALTAGDFVL